MDKPNYPTQLYLVTIMTATSLSLGCLILQFIIFPQAFGVLWVCLLLLQVVNFYAIYKLNKNSLDLPELYQYLKNTKV